ncbi:MAG: GNAT family N-acetyltransferase [Chloroflexota bacterium]|nr:GNAT family N-acetyltransferase [Chloroflexota bacterium]
MIVERLDRSRHDPSRFAFGKLELDSCIRDRPSRDEDERPSDAYVLIDPADSSSPPRGAGFFTLNSFAMPKRHARRRDRDSVRGGYNPVPAVLIGRLALDTAYQGRGLGGVLLVAALTRVLSLRNRLEIAVVVLHALDEDAATFYEHQGFTRFQDEPGHLYYPLATFEAALTSGG